MKLTIERLNLEYVAWDLDFGHGRNEQDIRFGQYLHNKYDMPSSLDVFYIEKADRAYQTCIDWLNKHMVQNVL